MIRIIYGSAGSGKSSRIYELMKADAENSIPSYLLVPEQETVLCERRLLDILPPRAQLTSEALNFSRLANLAFRKYGGLSYNYADKGSKTLIMWKNLRELAPMLCEYGKPAEESGVAFAEEMLDAVGELKAYCVSPQKLERAAERLCESDPLRRKLMDLSLISSAYQNMLSENFTDVADDLTKLSDLLRQHDFFSGKNVYIDSFTSFTAQEYEVIEEIFRTADNVTVALTLDSILTNQIHYESTADTAIRLLSIAKKLSIQVIEETLKPNGTKAPAIEEIAEKLWIPKAEPSKVDASGSIKIIECNDPYEEAEAAAGTALEQLQNGVRCRDIAIIARDASLYRGVIDIALSKAGIPYFFSQNSEILSKPPIKFLLAALKIKLYNWRSEDVISYLKTGLCDVSDRDVDLLECYLSVWNVRGSVFLGGDFTMNPDGYREVLTERGKEILSRINKCKNTFVPPLVKLFARLDAAENAADMCRALYLFTEENNVSEKLAAQAERDYTAGKRREAAELLQLYNSAVGALDSIAVSLSDSEISVKEFSEALKIMFDSISVGAIPTSGDQVTVGSASMLRTQSTKCAILIGLNEGEFPQNVRQSGLFTDNDKKMLGELGITLSADSSTRSSDELFYVYRAMSSPTEKLILLYHTNDFSGARAFPSLAVNRITKIFKDVQAERYSEYTSERKLLSAESAFEKLSSFKSTEIYEALLRYFDSNETYKHKIQASDIPKRNTLCRLDETTANELYGKSIRLTQTLIDDYSGCPFEYMCKRILGIREISSASFDYANFGTYIHYIFENYLRRAMSDGQIGKVPDMAYISRIVDETADAYIKRFFPSGEMESPRLSFRFRRMRKLATLVAVNLTREFEHSNFRPEFFELPIGRLDKEFSVSPLIFSTPSGKNAYIVGKVDRVDLLRRDGEVYVRVIDYKSGKKAFVEKDIEKGANVQLPLYLFALCDESQVGFRKAINVEKNQIIHPAGAMYLSSLIDPIDIIDEAYSAESVLAAAENSIARSGFITDNEAILKEMNFELSKNFLCGVTQNKDGTLKGTALRSDDDMISLRLTLENTVVGIADSMSSGLMDAAPSCSGGKYNCEYCKMQAICRSKLK